jgi:hypothetical protein
MIYRVSYWLTYGTNFIGGAGDSQSRAAWLIPMCIQILPALILAGGILFMPQSPRKRRIRDLAHPS